MRIKQNELLPKRNSSFFSMCADGTDRLKNQKKVAIDKLGSVCRLSSGSYSSSSEYAPMPSILSLGLKPSISPRWIAPKIR